MVPGVVDGVLELVHAEVENVFRERRVAVIPEVFGLRAEAHVDDARATGGCPVDPVDERGQRELAVVIGHFAVEQIGAISHTRDAYAVVGDAGDDPGDVGPVALDIARAGARAAEVAPVGDVWREVGMGLIDPAVEHRNQSGAGTAMRAVPGGRSLDPGHVPLLAEGAGHSAFH